jgi:glycosyltransferase involved in cell wall biosynthesis
VDITFQKLSTRQISQPADPDIVLYVPQNDVDDPEISIVVPAMNERISIGRFISWCQQGIQEIPESTEIIIIDSSTDETPQIALAAGARVLSTPKRGLGRAYIDAIPFIRGKFVIMGDADCTYDFRHIKPFVEQYRQGAEFVMGSRFKGSIEPGAMPALHRYFGTPVTTMILNLMYGTKFSDIHCGMRGITRDALGKINLSSQSWEYASEMVLKSVHANLTSSEVPIYFLKDMNGRESHMVRGGWREPWRAGWMNLRAMFMFGADFFLFVPGMTLLMVGLLGLTALCAGPINIGRYTLSVNSMLLALVIAIQGLNMLLLAVVARCLYDGDGVKRRYLLRLFAFDRTVVLCGLMIAAGFALLFPFVIVFVSAGFTYDAHAMTTLNHVAIIGLFLVVSGVFIFVSMLLMHAVNLYQANRVKIAQPLR